MNDVVSFSSVAFFVKTRNNSIQELYPNKKTSLRRFHRSICPKPDNKLLIFLCRTRLCFFRRLCFDHRFSFFRCRCFLWYHYLRRSCLCCSTPTALRRCLTVNRSACQTQCCDQSNFQQCFHTFLFFGFASLMPKHTTCSEKYNFFSIAQIYREQPNLNSLFSIPCSPFPSITYDVSRIRGFIYIWTTKSARTHESHSAPSLRDQSQL